MRIQLYDRRWLGLGLILAVLLHLILVELLGQIRSKPRPTPVELQTVDPLKLQKIRDQWRQKERALLLNRDPSLPKEKEAPKDARYESDRNTRVEKEQRARVTQVVPKAGSLHEQKQNPAQPKTPEKPKPKLQNLGVRGLTPRPPPEVIPVPQPQSNGGDQALTDSKLPEGSENMLNTQESVYYAFYARVYESVGPIWQSLIRSVPYRRRVPEGDYSTQVEVVFDTEGNIVQIRHHRDSGITDFDNAVDEAWKKMGRFPNPPKGLIQNDGYGHTGWTFTVNVGNGFNLESLPPERQY